MKLTPIFSSNLSQLGFGGPDIGVDIRDHAITGTLPRGVITPLEPSSAGVALNTLFRGFVPSGIPTQGFNYNVGYAPYVYGANMPAYGVTYGTYAPQAAATPAAYPPYAVGAPFYPTTYATATGAPVIYPGFMGGYTVGIPAYGPGAYVGYGYGHEDDEEMYGEGYEHEEYGEPEEYAEVQVEKETKKEEEAEKTQPPLEQQEAETKIEELPEKAETTEEIQPTTEVEPTIQETSAKEVVEPHEENQAKAPEAAAEGDIFGYSFRATLPLTMEQSIPVWQAFNQLHETQRDGLAVVDTNGRLVATLNSSNIKV